MAAQHHHHCKQNPGKCSLSETAKDLPQSMIVQFYTAIMESILTSFIRVWFGSAIEQDKARLQLIIHSEERIGCNLATLLGTTLEPGNKQVRLSRTAPTMHTISLKPYHPEKYSELSELRPQDTLKAFSLRLSTINQTSL